MGDNGKKQGGFSLFGKSKPPPEPKKAGLSKAASAPAAAPRQPFQWRPGLPMNFKTSGTVTEAVEKGVGLVIQCNGQDPQILLPELDYAGKHVILEADVTLPAPTQAQVYVQTRDNRRYVEKQSVAVAAGPGRQRLEFSLSAFEVCGALRFDPGRVPGDYTLHGLAIRLQ